MSEPSARRLGDGRPLVRLGGSARTGAPFLRNGPSADSSRGSSGIDLRGRSSTSPGPCSVQHIQPPQPPKIEGLTAMVANPFVHSAIALLLLPPPLTP